MTTVLLVRHALCDSVGHSIAGRAPGVLLNEDGRRQCRRLADALASAPLRAVYTGPLERARQTAEAIARPRGLEPIMDERLHELDFGEWTGRTLAELEGDERWRRFNRFRSGTRIPGGEMMLEAQARAVAAVCDIAERHQGEHLVAVSHGDVIRAVLLHFLGMPLDHVHRLDVGPASVSELELSPDGARIRAIGDSPARA